MPMEAQPPQFTGTPCGHHGSYTFYRGFRYTKNGIPKDLSLGEFFFVRLSAEVDPCIGELQLLCSTRNNEQQLSALRLYFLPEQTPEGRLSHHGEDEVLVASDRIVLKLEDLVTWLTEEVEWNHGILAPVCKPAKEQDTSPAVKEEIKKDGQEETKEEEEDKKDPSNEKEETKSVEVKVETSEDDPTPKGTNVVVLSYQKYCRFRCIMKRIEGGASDQWLQDPLVIALGGFTATNKNTRVLFCRDNFEHDELAHHELNCEYLAPTIKGKRRKRKAKNVRSTSPESNSSVESKVLELKNNKKQNGLKQPPVKNEEEFLERLYNFMKQRNTPIHRVPHLGFKQIDLFRFYSFSLKLGGYDKITDKRLWKHVYDELGGNPGSTSAATCTRRHYEKLLLPFERYMDGIVYKPATRGKKSLKRKLEKENTENTNDTIPVKSEPAPGTSSEANEADAYNFTDSNHENSDSNFHEFNSICDEQSATNEAIYSDEDSKTVWSIQKQPENKSEVDKEDTKAIKPLIIQKGQGETFAEKERKWDEIRRKNAAARKWVRQSRSSSKGCKTPVPEVANFNGEKAASLGSDTSDVHKPPEDIKIKTETSESQPPQNVPITPNHNQPSQDKIDPSPPSANHIVSKLPPVHSEAIQNVINKLENQKKLMARGKEAPASISCDKNKTSHVVKSEPIDIPSKSWSGYPVSSEQSSFKSSYSSMESNIPAHIKNQITPSYKNASRSESDYPSLHTGRQSVGSMSASSAISGDTSLNEENKPLLSQRRPSVIQHTEYAATTPSPTPSPKQGSSDVFNMYPKDVMQCVQFNNPKMNLPPNQMGYSMNGKVAEWLTKGVHEVVACKTPSSVEKTVELHDKVMMPSSCKTPGIVGTGKIPPSNAKNKHSAKGCAKSPRSKYTTSHHHQRISDGNPLPNGNYSLSRNEIRNNSMYQKTFHPTPTSYNSVMTNPVSAAKYQQTANPKPEFYPNNPYFNQQKRFKYNSTTTPLVLPGVGTRPPSLPYVRQQTYRAAPLSDIPKTTATHNDYDSVVLDLSVKKKPTQTVPSRTVNPPPVSTSPVPEGVCLDLSIKKKPNISNDNGIENITPPLPLSPNPSQAAAPYLSSTLKPLPTLISIQDFQSAAIESARHSYSSSSNRHTQMMNSPASSSSTGPSLVMPQTNAMYPASTHSKLPQSIVNTMPVAYSKEIAKNLYMPSTTRHSQFSPYVIPPFFPSSWTSVVNANVNNPKQTNNSQTSPMAYKGMVNHSVFPKDYPSQYKSQFHPVLCKDNGHYPSNAK